jgi:hypothetical protein
MTIKTSRQILLAGPVRIYLCIALIGICSASSCGQTPQAKLIDEVNATKRKARNLGDEAEQKRAAAGQKRNSGDEAEYDKLIKEAANLYGQAGEKLNEAAVKADEIAKVKQPEWYKEYFGLHAKLTRNLARLAAGAHDELLIRLSGPPTESQLQSWKETLSRINKENEEFRTRIKTIEKREGSVLIKE